MKVPSAIVLAAVLLAPPVLLLEALPSEAQGGVGAVLLATVGGYGPEAWKDVPPAGRVFRDQDLPPLPGLPGPADPHVYENPYFDPSHPHQGGDVFLGANLTAFVEVRDGAGKPATSPGHYIEAHIESLDGVLPARLAKVGPARFEARFDLDGDDATGLEPVLPGAMRLVVDVFRVPATPDPLIEPARVATTTFELTMGTAGLDRGGLLLPEAILPGYADVGQGNQTLVMGELVAPAEAFTISASLGAPNAAATIVAWNGDTGRVLWEGTTDASGRTPTASVEGSQLTGANASGLVVVEAHLATGPTFASATLAVPVSAHPTKVLRYLWERRGVPGSGVTLDPLATLYVGVSDPTAAAEAPVGGTVYAIDNGQVLASADFSKDTFVPGADERGARLLGAQLIDAIRPRGLSTYRVVAFLTTDDGRLYSLAQSVRGYALTAQTPATTAPGQHAELVLTLRNFNNNLDQGLDPGMSLAAQVNVTALPGGGAFATQVTVEESGESRITVPFTGEAGRYTVQVNTTSDEFEQGTQVPVTIAAAQRGLLGLPGPGLLAAMAALAAAGGALAVQRRRTR